MVKGVRERPVLTFFPCHVSSKKQSQLFLPIYALSLFFSFTSLHFFPIPNNFPIPLICPSVRPCVSHQLQTAILYIHVSSSPQLKTFLSLLLLVFLYLFFFLLDLFSLVPELAVLYTSCMDIYSRLYIRWFFDYHCYMFMDRGSFWCEILGRGTTHIRQKESCYS